MKDIKTSNVVKVLCYLLIPILTIVIFISSCSFVYVFENKENFNGAQNYFQTKEFANMYLSRIYDSVLTITRVKENKIQNNLVQEEQVGNEEKNDSAIDYYKLIPYADYYILIIRDGEVYTNVEKTAGTDSSEKIKQYILSQDRYWKFVNGEVDTNIEQMKYHNILYNYYFGVVNEQKDEIYTSVPNDATNSFYINALIYDIASKTYEFAPISIIIGSLTLLACIVYLMLSIGHKKGITGIYLSKLDEIPLEIYATIAGTLLSLEGVLLTVFITIAGNEVELFNIAIASALVMGILIYLTLVACVITLIRRIKARKFWKTTLCYRVFNFFRTKITNLIQDIFQNFSITVKALILYGGIILGSVFLISCYATSGIGFFIFVLLAFWYYIFRKLLRIINQWYDIRKKIEEMYRGKVEEKLPIDGFKGEFKEIAIELNDISGGLSNAIEEGLKSERMKTELITNVSHDIKTPLTSIINYVDLLKKEDIQGEKVQEYLQILDAKSQRLKRLTEDLVEASKASSGNIKLTMKELKVKELISQVNAEFEDKFKEKGLNVIESGPEEEVSILADSKYVYRILENVYTNISKYALENSRVYIDIVEEKEKVRIEMKNISREKLNISEEELMQRFVRGDSARTTEGSGLGISIAKSLTELQKGKFTLHLDGDLFKVMIEFQKIS